MINAVRQFFEDHAPTWDDRMPADIVAILQRFTAPTAGIFSTVHSILEIGTGTGAFVPVLREYAPDARLVSIDIALGMLQMARRRCPPECYIQADVHHLPVAAVQFDLVVCHNSFPHFADKSRALREMGRILQAGGKLMILHNNSRTFVNKIHRQAGDPIADDLLPPGEELSQWLMEAGYQDVQVDDTPVHYIAIATAGVQYSS
jgi:demethylmenaquinone methyltransferase/2-methoxy-6-polyprenyl-1,4-benzoquinol methylase